jgi:hypothetical protein
MSQSEVRERIRQISAGRREWDELFSELQGLLKGRLSRLPTAKVRQEFMQRVERLREAVRNNTEELERIKYRVERMRQEGTKLST